MLNNTHYDILKVTRDASSDAIHAAYKELTQQYLSDSTPSVQATNLMKIVHHSYAILSNPVQKLKYDQWLQDLEVTQVEFTSREQSHQVPKGAGKRIKLPDLKPITAQTPLSDTPSAEPLSASADAHIQSAETTEKQSLTDAGTASQDIAAVTYAEMYPSVPPSGSYPAIRRETDLKKTRYRPLITSLGLLALSVIIWFVFVGASDDSEPDPSAPVDMQTKVHGHAQPASPVPQATDQQITVDGQDIQNPLTMALPDHDKAAISAFTGIWKGRNADVLQSLEITAKSDGSLVFRLESKSGENSGEIYGIADYSNGYAQFFNKEYNCNILFTIKSEVIQLATSSCQEYHESGVIFDGSYSKPAPIREVKKPLQPAVNSGKQGAAATRIGPEKPAAASVSSSLPKLRKFSATVKDSAGNVSTIELVAEDKDAARAIIRDFRGNPKVIRIREVKN